MGQAKARRNLFNGNQASSPAQYANAEILVANLDEDDAANTCWEAFLAQMPSVLKPNAEATLSLWSKYATSINDFLDTRTLQPGMAELYAIDGTIRVIPVSDLEAFSLLPGTRSTYYRLTSEPTTVGLTVDGMIRPDGSPVDPDFTKGKVRMAEGAVVPADWPLMAQFGIIAQSGKANTNAAAIHARHISRISGAAAHSMFAMGGWENADWEFHRSIAEGAYDAKRSEVTPSGLLKRYMELIKLVSTEPFPRAYCAAVGNSPLGIFRQRTVKESAVWRRPQDAAALLSKHSGIPITLGERSSLMVFDYVSAAKQQHPAIEEYDVFMATGRVVAEADRLDMDEWLRLYDFDHSFAFVRQSERSGLHEVVTWPKPTEAA